MPTEQHSQLAIDQIPSSLSQNQIKLCPVCHSQLIDFPNCPQCQLQFQRIDQDPPCPRPATTTITTNPSFTTTPKKHNTPYITHTTSIQRSQTQSHFTTITQPPTSTNTIPLIQATTASLPHKSQSTSFLDPLADITRIRIRSKPHHCLYPGAVYQGTQKSGRNSYDVNVTIVVRLRPTFLVFSLHSIIHPFILFIKYFILTLSLFL